MAHVVVGLGVNHQQGYDELAKCLTNSARTRQLTSQAP